MIHIPCITKKMPSRHHSTIRRRDRTRDDLAVRTLAISAASPHTFPVAQVALLKRCAEPQRGDHQPKHAEGPAASSNDGEQDLSHAQEGEHTTEHDCSADGQRPPPKATFRHNHRSFPMRTGLNVSTPGNGRPATVVGASPTTTTTPTTPAPYYLARGY
jgi:hypothetical protein